MTATFTAERRRASPTPPRPLRELPVLFHLMDVSRPKGYAAPPPPAFTLGSLAEEPDLPASAEPRQGRNSSLTSQLASELVSEPPLDSARSFDLETAAELVQTKAYGSLPIESPRSTAALSDSIDEAATSSQADDAAPAGDSFTATSTLETPPPAGDDAVTLRQRAEERQRKRREWLKDDWFSSQGRFIAIGFVIALVVTIYVARSGRKPAAAPSVAAKSHAHPGEASSAKARIAKNSAKQAAATESAKITSVRPTQKPVATSEPKTALHPPTIPQLANQPAAANSPADATLFTFSKRADERVATRTDAPAVPSTGSIAPSPPAPAVPSPQVPSPHVPNTQVPSAQVPSAQVPSAQPPSSPAPPTLQPQYPATNYPSTYQPAAPPSAYAAPPGVYAPPPGAYASPPGTYAPPPGAYAPPPATYAPPGAYASPPGTYAPPPGAYAPPSAPAGPALNPAASSAPLYPTTNTASGYRHERTGSSVY